jgi:phosphoribosylformylglycinamidine synthase
MTVHEVRVEVTPLQTEGMRDVLGDVVQHQLFADHGIDVGKVRSIRGYLIRSEYDAGAIEPRVQDIFSDPIIEHGATNTSLLNDKTFFPIPPSLTITVGFKPGVTDNPGAAANDGFKLLFPDGNSAISTYISYAFLNLSESIDHEWLASTLFNGLIEKSILTTRTELESGQATTLSYPERPSIERQPPAIINMELSDEELIRLSNEGLLALNLNEMQTIRDHYRDEPTRLTRQSVGISPDAPTDVELECLAQTWSEHCKHKIFASKIHHIDTETGEDTIVDSLFKTHIMKPTHDMAKEGRLAPVSFPR